MANEVKAVSFKMPMATWEIIRDVAEMSGIDVASVINCAIAAELPHLVRVQSARNMAMAMARDDGVGLGVNDFLARLMAAEGNATALAVTTSLIRHLEEVKVKLAPLAKAEAAS